MDGPDDIGGMDASAAQVANLLSFEPSDVRIGIGRFSMGTQNVAIHVYMLTASSKSHVSSYFISWHLMLMRDRDGHFFGCSFTTSGVGFGVLSISKWYMRSAPK